MKEHWKLSKEALLSVEEGQSQEEIEERVKRISSAAENKCNCAILINIVKLVLYVELVLLLTGSCIVLWQTYYSQSSKTSPPTVTILKFPEELTRESSLSGENITREESSTTEQDVSDTTTQRSFSESTTGPDPHINDDNEFLSQNFETSTQAVISPLPKTRDIEEAEELEEEKSQQKEENEWKGDESKSNEGVLDWGFPPYIGFSLTAMDSPMKSVNSEQSMEKTMTSESEESAEKSEDKEKGQSVDDTRTIASIFSSDSSVVNNKSDERSESSEERSEETNSSEEKSDSTSTLNSAVISKEAENKKDKQTVEGTEDPASDDLLIVNNSGSQWVKFPSWYEDLFLQHEKLTNLYKDYINDREESAEASSDETLLDTEEETINLPNKRAHHIRWISFTSPQEFPSEEIEPNSHESVNEESVEGKNSKEMRTESETSIEKERNFRTDEPVTVDINEDSSKSDEIEVTTSFPETNDEIRRSSEMPEHDFQTSDETEDVKWQTDESITVKPTTDIITEDYYTLFDYDGDYSEDYFDELYKRWRRSLKDDDGNVLQQPINVEEKAISNDDDNDDAKTGVVEKDEIQKPPHLRTDESDETVKRRKSRQSPYTVNSLDSAMFNLKKSQVPLYLNSLKAMYPARPREINGLSFYRSMNNLFPLDVVKMNAMNMKKAYSPNENARVRSENEEKKRYRA